MDDPLICIYLDTPRLALIKSAPLGRNDVGEWRRGNVLRCPSVEELSALRCVISSLSQLNYDWDKNFVLCALHASISVSSQLSATRGILRFVTWQVSAQQSRRRTLRLNITDDMGSVSI